VVVGWGRAGQGRKITLAFKKSTDQRADLTCINVDQEAALGRAGGLGADRLSDGLNCPKTHAPNRVYKNSLLHSTTMKRYVTCIVEKAGFRVEPRTLGTKAERNDHCATRPVK
jgi:hypothetical protein